MNRGDIITVVTSGDHGKPRPAVVIQADMVKTGTVLTCLMTSDTEMGAPYRLLLKPDSMNGLRKPSLIQADKIYPIAHARCGHVIGRLTPEEIAMLDLNLLFVLGLGE